jgi:hypothetical protein
MGDVDIAVETTELQWELAFTDRDTAYAAARVGGMSPLILTRLQNVKVKMYKEAHCLPHVHVDYGREHHVASYSVDPPRLLAGTLGRAHDEKVILWLTKHRTRVLEVWTSVQAGIAPSGILAELGESQTL